MTDAVPCRSCGFENTPGRDFCQGCGEYLAWAPTGMMPAVPEGSLVPEEPPAVAEQPPAVAEGDEPRVDAGAISPPQAPETASPVAMGPPHSSAIEDPARVDLTPADASENVSKGVPAAPADAPTTTAEPGADAPVPDAPTREAPAKSATADQAPMSRARRRAATTRATTRAAQARARDTPGPEPAADGTPEPAAVSAPQAGDKVAERDAVADSPPEVVAAPLDGGAIADQQAEAGTPAGEAAAADQQPEASAIAGNEPEGSAVAGDEPQAVAAGKQAASPGTTAGSEQADEAVSSAPSAPASEAVSPAPTPPAPEAAQPVPATAAPESEAAPQDGVSAAASPADEPPAVAARPDPVIEDEPVYVTAHIASLHAPAPAAAPPADGPVAPSPADEAPAAGAQPERDTGDTPVYVTADIASLHDPTRRAVDPFTPPDGQNAIPMAPADDPYSTDEAAAAGTAPVTPRRGSRLPTLKRGARRRGSTEAGVVKAPGEEGELETGEETAVAEPSLGGDGDSERASANGAGGDEVPPTDGDEAGLPSTPPTGDASLVVIPADPAIAMGGIPTVEAGGTVSFRAAIRNESQIVDNYDLAVLGPPENWAMVSPAAAFLVPLGSGRGDSETELRIDIRPPRDYRSTAGIWTFELVAMSRTHGTIAARAIAQFEVLPFASWSVEVVPSVNKGRFKSHYRTAVRNDGNAMQTLYPAAIDDSGRLRSRFAAGALTLDAGEVASDTLTLRPRLPKPVGRVIEHRVGVDVLATAPEVDESDLTPKEKLRKRAEEEKAKAKDKAKGAAKGAVKVSATGVRFKAPRIPTPKSLMRKFMPKPAMLSRLRPGGADVAAPTTARQVVFRQKPVIPLWVVGLMLLCALAALLLYLLWPQKTNVPVLEGQPDSFAAEKILRDKGLVLSQPPDRKTDLNATPGSVIDQSPAAGDEVEEGSSVSIVVADGDTKVEVPRLQGLTAVKADERLRVDGLELGEVQPPDAPKTFVVDTHIPDVGLSVAAGTKVTVYLKKPPPSSAAKKAAAKDKAADKAKAAKAAAAAAAAKKKAADNPKIPAFDDKKVDDYVKDLDKLGLEASVGRKPASKEVGLVIGTVPAVGETAKKGATVTVTVSSGPAPIAVQTPSRVLVLAPVGGKELFRFPGAAAEPSYYPNGERLVYRSGSRIVEATTGKDPKLRTLFSGSDDLVRPTIAPNNAALALIRREEGDGDLCFGNVGSVDLAHLCLPDDGWDLDGRISWRKDGKAVLVPGRRRSNPAIFGVRVYTSNAAFARDPLLWTGKTATPVSTPGKGVRVAAFSPGGTRIAAISNLESDKFELVFAPADELVLADPKATGTAGCDVAWRGDGQELAIVQGDATCSQAFGKIVRVAPGKPDKPTDVTARGRNPAYSTR